MSTVESPIYIASDYSLARQQLQRELRDLVELGKTACSAYYGFLGVDSPFDLTSPVDEYSSGSVRKFGSRRFSSDPDKRVAYKATSLKVYTFSCHNNWLDGNELTVMDEGHLVLADEQEREQQSVGLWDDVPLEVRNYFNEYACKSAQLNARLSGPYDALPIRQRYARDHQRSKLAFTRDLLAGMEPIETALFDALHTLEGAESSVESRLTALSAFTSSSQTLVRRLEEAGRDFGMMTNHVRKTTMDIVLALGASVPSDNEGVEAAVLPSLLLDTTLRTLAGALQSSVGGPITSCVVASRRYICLTPREYQVDTGRFMQHGPTRFFFMTGKHRRQLRGDLRELANSAYKIQRLDSEEAAVLNAAAETHPRHG